MSKKEELRGLLSQKQSKSFYANKLRVSELDIDNLMREIREEESDIPDITDEEESITHNLETGKLKSTKFSSIKPTTPEEIIALHEIDVRKWKLSQFWSKQKRDGWLVSALFSAIGEDNIGELEYKTIVKEVFEQIRLRPYNNPKFPSNKKALFLYTSDKHVAAQTKANSIYDNHYDGSVFDQRMMAIIPEIKYLVSIYGVFEDIIILDLGDSLDGESGYTTRGGHKLPQNLSNKEAFRSYLTTHKRFFDDIVEMGFANNYSFSVQSEDNHGGDFAYAANEAVITYLNAKYPAVNTSITDRFFNHFVYGDHTFIITHGKDSEDLKHGFPLHVNDKTENYINKYIDYHKISTPYIHVIKGDLHQEAFERRYKFTYRNVLSIYGMSKWMANNFGPSVPGVSYDIIEKDTERMFSSYMILK